MLNLERKIADIKPVLQPSHDDLSVVRQTAIECLDLRVKTKRRHEEKERRNKEKNRRTEIILEEVLKKPLVGQKSTSIQDKIVSLCSTSAQSSIDSVSSAVMEQLKLDVASARLKAMASTRSTEDPSLSNAQAEILKIVKMLALKEKDDNSIADKLYRGKDGEYNPELLEYERRARKSLMATLANKADRNDCIAMLAQRSYRDEVAWLRREVGTLIDLVTTRVPNTEASEQNRIIEIIARAEYELRTRQAADPVNPAEVRRLIAESVIYPNALRIVVIKCLAHEYRSGIQNVVSIYSQDSELTAKESEFLQHVLDYQQTLRGLDIPVTVTVAVADTDIPYQREERTEGIKWIRAQAQIQETAALYQRWGINVVSLMDRVITCGCKDRHDKTYLEVKQRPLSYIPTEYLERRINKRYVKYKPLEDMTRERARQIVINSYAEEAALGNIWKDLWGDCLHLVYKTMYLSSAMEAYRNSKSMQSKNIPTVYSSGQGKRGADGEED